MADQPAPRELLESSFDRIREASFYITQMEHTYHYADPFRWSLNGFLRALKEIPQIIQMELQNRDGFTAWFNQRIESVKTEALIQYLGKQRDIVVHRKMLKPASSGTIGVTEGRGAKLGIHLPINPLEDSDSVMDRLLRSIAESEDPLADILGVLGDDEESMPCIIREWKLDAFPDQELTALARAAWIHMSNLLSDTVMWLGGEALKAPPPAVDPEKIGVRMYSRKEINEWYESIKQSIAPQSPSNDAAKRELRTKTPNLLTQGAKTIPGKTSKKKLAAKKSTIRTAKPRRQRKAR